MLKDHAGLLRCLKVCVSLGGMVQDERSLAAVAELASTCALSVSSPHQCSVVSCCECRHETFAEMVRRHTAGNQGDSQWTQLQQCQSKLHGQSEIGSGKTSRHASLWIARQALGHLIISAKVNVR